ncbi:hypothetical protein GCM10011611_40140 [Aliidongia dinghuensis]|uniref:Uncharacterized protein n=1 Tax=Aliidongia dinghuensis TaxID=1867774 RepID=A0A8J2YW33_9PROT|nr:hypothetical protein GCM10011611_40140 [Aliidongia dinghuensis]
MRFCAASRPPSALDEALASESTIVVAPKFSVPFRSPRHPELPSYAWGAVLGGENPLAGSAAVPVRLVAPS